MPRVVSFRGMVARAKEISAGPRSSWWPWSPPPPAPIRRSGFPPEIIRRDHERPKAILVEHLNDLQEPADIGLPESDPRPFPSWKVITWLSHHLLDLPLGGAQGWRLPPNGGNGAGRARAGSPGLEPGFVTTAAK